MTEELFQVLTDERNEARWFILKLRKAIDIALTNDDPLEGYKALKAAMDATAAYEQYR